MNFMSNRVGGLLERGFACLLALLAVIGASLFAIFNLLATSHLNVTIGLTSFVIVAVLLTLGYALGFLTIAFLGIFFVTRIWQRQTEPVTKTKH